jgi:hypothetical protein
MVRGHHDNPNKNRNQSLDRISRFQVKIVLLKSLEIISYGYSDRRHDRESGIVSGAEQWALLDLLEDR